MGGKSKKKQKTKSKPKNKNINNNFNRNLNTSVQENVSLETKEPILIESTLGKDGSDVNSEIKTTDEPTSTNATAALIETPNISITEVIACPGEIKNEKSNENFENKIESKDQVSNINADEEKSLRDYLSSLNIAAPQSECIDITSTVFHKDRIPEIKNIDVPLRSNLPLFLDVIDEEGSNSSSGTSRRHSYLNDQNFDLEDDVFVTRNEINKMMKIEKRPQHISAFKPVISSKSPVPQECLLVGTKIIEHAANEGCGNWTVQTLDKPAGAEVVYLTDSSSSASDIQESVEEYDNSNNESVVRIETPVIEINKCLNFADKPLEKEIHNKESSLSDSLKELTYSEPVEEESKEILVTSTDNIKTTLFVLEANQNSYDCNYKTDEDISNLKMELNSAFTSLINEVDKPNTKKVNEQLSRQDSLNSVCSSQSDSHSTAKYFPASSSLTDVAAFLHESGENRDISDHNSHVKDVIQRCVSDSHAVTTKNILQQPQYLKEICVKNIYKLPFGEKILEELASVSESLQNFEIFSNSKKSKKDRVSANIVQGLESLYNKNTEKSSPPPISPRNSSFKRSEENSLYNPRATISTESIIPISLEPPIYRCRSPSQKLLMEQTQTLFDNISLFESSKPTRRNSETNVFNLSSNNQKNVGRTSNRLLDIISNPDVSSNFDTDVRSLKYKSSSDMDLSRKIDYYKPARPPRPRAYSATIYESDENVESNDSYAFINDHKNFTSSTGNLNKDIENSIKDIQNLHRNITEIRESNFSKRKLSLPKDINDSLMNYISDKDYETDDEIKKLELGKHKLEKRGPRAPMLKEKDLVNEFRSQSYQISKKRDVAIRSDNNNSSYHLQNRDNISPGLKSSQDEILREKMYAEYINKIAEREDRKHHKIIKISTKPSNRSDVESNISHINHAETKGNLNKIEEEFIAKAKERWDKLGIKDPETETEDERDTKKKKSDTVVIEHKIKVIEGGEEKDVKRLPSHLREFVQFTASENRIDDCGSGESDEMRQNSTLFVLFLVATAATAVTMACIYASKRF